MVVYLCHLSTPVVRQEAEAGKSTEAYEPASLLYEEMNNQRMLCL